MRKLKKPVLVHVRALVPIDVRTRALGASCMHRARLYMRSPRAQLSRAEWILRGSGARALVYVHSTRELGLWFKLGIARAALGLC